jgi:predicted transcriptional regulator
MKYRSRTDIVSQILQSANGGTTKTRIMYNAYLSYAQLKEYLVALTENGLLEHLPENNTFRTTPKGLSFIKTYEKMGQLSLLEVKQ